MAGLFAPMHGGGAEVRLAEVEVSVLRGYTSQLLDLIGPAPRPDDGDADALLASVFADHSDTTPTDPVLARLFPDGYGDPDRAADDATRAAAADFRRHTESDLRSRKRADADSVLRDLAALGPVEPDGAVLRLDPDECRHWLGTLNDLRLALGTRLDIGAEHDSDSLLELPDTDDRKPGAMVYLWLSGLQETLIDAITGQD